MFQDQGDSLWPLLPSVLQALLGGGRLRALMHAGISLPVLPGTSCRQARLCSGPAWRRWKVLLLDFASEP